jgi:VIT1/CCC1 family predicted Fe2+/Mn2+ transporter
MDSADRGRIAANIQEEVDGAFLYRRLAGIESDPRLAELYRRLAETEERHRSFWEDELRAAGAPVSPAGVSRGARILAWTARRFGTGAILSVLGSTEREAALGYDSQPEAAGTGLPGEERSHARSLSTLAGDGGAQGSRIARLEGRHRAVGGNALRAAVLGANDGLVSNLSLVMGVAGATNGGTGVLIAGLSGLLAGGLSMALGEWLSVQSSRELHQAQIAAEAAELAAAPEEEAQELALIYEAKGLPADLARQMAGRIISNPASALDTLAREELGVDPDTLGGSAWEAAIASFLLFVTGAVVPVLPFVFARGAAAMVISVSVGAVALFLVGAAITIVTAKSVWRSGLRQVLFGLVAAAITFGIGRAVGIAVGG